MVKSARIIDSLVLILSIAVVVAAALWLAQDGVFNIILAQDSQISWHLIRSLGITAYILLTVSVVWGLALSSRLLNTWSPGPLTMLMHSTLSWLALLLGFGHAILLMADKYFSYTLQDVLVPFVGPYRPLAVGLGTLSIWLLLFITLSFSVKRLIGQRAWKLLHYGSYLTFLMVTVHGLTAGTDAGNLGFRILIGICVTITVLLLGIRIGRRSDPAPKAVPERVHGARTGRPTR